ncbi:hypothetical protein [uncultured Tateyamaria sp.]|uniref:hypothetical protein n=1 Tax=uncultured Tateyamaria sp. TaxID=455651 RepID=UPI00260F9F8E|nr:hypothetical protein [uncultured Tateyamaria sp.]
MKRSIIATGVALALTFVAITSSAAMTYTFPPDIAVQSDTDSDPLTNRGFKSSKKK